MRYSDWHPRSEDQAEPRADKLSPALPRLALWRLARPGICKRSGFPRKKPCRDAVGCRRKLAQL